MLLKETDNSPKKVANCKTTNGEVDCCEEYQVHDELVLEREKYMLQAKSYQEKAQIYKALGDPTRLRILHGLSQGELCVCDLAYLLKMSQSAISHQLRLLRTLKLVRYRKEGKMVYYALEDQPILKILQDDLELR
ncbi:winged helix-turn-helix transcriptional regulator [Heliorestis acidaminivorans]|uniref:Winged helix-turn-helix transcriptional regulator n=1 Tax=Heliorestis acidaminivorans TaxID=553427 RepID=A0A6I0EZE9_9FIRM|nr:metalloregulator ArsR/SmtB family transcription factor [Heliorestis acidaminivorans]KAB2953886.1 winged helix-turn-helix transcriptional regulator [Heliorestis acidaminivorans]